MKFSLYCAHFKTCWNHQTCVLNNTFSGSTIQKCYVYFQPPHMMGPGGPMGMPPPGAFGPPPGMGPPPNQQAGGNPQVSDIFACDEEL